MGRVGRVAPPRLSSSSSSSFFFFFREMRSGGGGFKRKSSALFKLEGLMMITAQPWERGQPGMGGGGGGETTSLGRLAAREDAS